MEERIDKLEMMVNRLLRRTNKTTSVIIPPFPISGAAFGDVSRGVIYYMFPIDGTIVKGMVDLIKKVKDDVIVDLVISGESDGMSKSFTVDKRTASLQLDIPVKAGDRLIVTVSPANPEVVIDSVWVTLLWAPSVKESSVKQFLTDELNSSEVV